MTILLQFYHYIFIVVGALLLSGFFFSIWLVFAIAQRVYWHTLTRMKDTDWRRECSKKDNEEQAKMWDDGIAYMSQFQDKKEELEITSFDHLKLCAEYYDFHQDKTVIFLCGRCECLIYAYYYAKPYVDMGYNLLFVDQRAHGNSEGKYSTVGILENKDIMKWIDYLKLNKKQSNFYFHCVCVGGVSGSLVASNDQYKDDIKGLVLDGAFLNFEESYKRHYVHLGHKTFPVFYLIWFWFKYYTKQSVKLSSPYNALPNVKCPTLFLHGKQDIFSLAKNAEILYARSGSEKKQIVYFDEGSHSHLRNNNIEKYDQSIINFYQQK